MRVGLVLVLGAPLLAIAGAASAQVNARVTTELAETGCPSRAEVEAALEARAPSITSAPAALVDKTLALELEPVDAGVDLAVRDDSGQVLLRRHLVSEAKFRPPGRQRCWALAEAAAVVVTRYLRQIGYRPPPEPAAAPAAAVAETPAATSDPSRTSPADSAPAEAAEAPGTSLVESAPAAAGDEAPAADGDEAAAAELSSPAFAESASFGPQHIFLGAGVGGRVGVGEGDRYPRAELLVDIALHFETLAVALGAGTSAETRIEVPGPQPGGLLTLRAFPLRAGLGLPLSLGTAGWLVPVVAGGIDVLSFRATQIADAQSGLRVEPVIEGGLSYLATGGRFFGRIRVMGGVTLRANVFDAMRVDPIFRTPNAYLRAQLEIGIRIGKG